ncbi:MAG: Ala-tRNA(Pro) hydrolase [Chloroflexi bacterium UTCFX4]|jgi:misacylated tRNA(Ala) deacylase|nr:MAG: Ala-tRNA(Pro) hydrolase [Chloroflexi bacterium UTCFX4]
MTELLYHSDAYLREFDAIVAAVDAERVALDRTALYARSGGQPSDFGILMGNGVTFRVLDSKKQGDQVWHQLDSAGLEAGDTLRGAVDWVRRYKLMRTHTALHILCGVIFRDYGASVTGGDMESLAARMDFEFDRMSAEFAHEVEERINAEVAAARDVRVKILPRAKAFEIPDLIRTKINLLPAGIEQVRVVEIVGLDLQADGGTHVANTREVGTIRVVGHESKGKINKRLRIEIGD